MSDVDALVARGEFSKPTQQGLEKQQELFEENVGSVQRYRWKNQAELAHWGSRFVNIMSQNEFLRKLNKVGELVGWRAHYNDFSRNGMRGINIVSNYGKKVYLCAANNSYAPEFSLMRFDEHFVPQNEIYRGWRTVLLRLIERGFATETQVHQIFGEPTLGMGSRRYREELYLTRNFGQIPNPWTIE